MIRCLWGFMCEAGVFQNHGGPCAIGIHDQYTVSGLPLRIPAPDFMLYLDGNEGDTSKLRVFILTPDQELLLPEGRFDVEFGRAGTQVYLLRQVGDESGGLPLSVEGTYTVAVMLDDRMQIVVRFQVRLEGGDSDAAGRAE